MRTSDPRAPACCPPPPCWPRRSAATRNKTSSRYPAGELSRASAAVTVARRRLSPPDIQQRSCDAHPVRPISPTPPALARAGHTAQAGRGARPRRFAPRARVRSPPPLSPLAAGPPPNPSRLRQLACPPRPSGSARVVTRPRAPASCMAVRVSQVSAPDSCAPWRCAPPSPAPTPSPPDIHQLPTTNTQPPRPPQPIPASARRPCVCAWPRSRPPALDSVARGQSNTGCLQHHLATSLPPLHSGPAPLPSPLLPAHWTDRLTIDQLTV